MKNMKNYLILKKNCLCTDLQYKNNRGCQLLASKNIRGCQLNYNLTESTHCALNTRRS
jgi:hypothetical protein